MNTVRKRFNLQVTTANQVVTEKFELDKTAKKILGFLITSDAEDLIFYRGTQRIELSGTELFPEDYETKILMFSLNVPLNERYYNMKDKNVELGNGIIKVTYTDNASPRMYFRPYRVSLYVEYEV